MSEQVPEEGEVWFVKLPEQAHIHTVTISKVTEKTVKIQDGVSYGSGGAVPLYVRYKRGDIEFVERKHAVPVGRATLARRER